MISSLCCGVFVEDILSVDDIPDILAVIFNYLMGC